MPAAGLAASRPPSGRAILLGWIVAVLCVAFGTALRAHVALTDPNFDRESPVGLLKSDPGLLYYFTESIVAAGGRPPADFRADPRVEHPEAVDIPAKFTVGQEFAVAWGYLLLGRGMPLHVFSVWIMAVWASLSALCVFGLALELTASARWAVLAAALHAAMPASYRTIGWILMSEDFSVPWFALHLWLIVRAARVRSPVSILLASFALGAAVSTWHAMSFVFALEAACVFAWFLRTGRNPLETRAAWIFPIILLAFSSLVPVLRSTAFALSIPMQMTWALGAAALWPRNGQRAAAIAVWVVLAAAAFLWSRISGAGIGDYGHVFSLLVHKVRHLGILPDDPGVLPIETRMMWQGPFATLGLEAGLRSLGIGALAIVPALAYAWRGLREARGEPGVLASAFACVSLLSAWLIERTVLLPGILLPCVAAWSMARFSRSRPRAILGGLALLALILQGVETVRFLKARPLSWYLPVQRQAEIRALVEAIPTLVPEGEAIASDFMNSTAILAHTGRGIVFQPKWESKRSRERAAEFLTSFFHGTPEELKSLLRDRFRCRYVVFDRFTLGILQASRYAAGIPADWDGPEPGTCAAAFLAQDEESLRGVPGYRLLYRSPASIRQSDGSPADFFRLYEVVP
ncbi:MAG: hypothetical protein ACKVXR_16565 [Planctomycetota bacterium]